MQSDQGAYTFTASPSSIQETYIQRGHCPAHLFRPDALYSVSAGTFHKACILNTPEKKKLLIRNLFEQIDHFHWQIEAWAVLNNHYHFVAQAMEDSHALSKLLQAVHSITAREFNALDQTPGRKVWYQYWDTCITNEKSYYARLRYVHENPVKHGVVTNAADYPWCSMRWLIEGISENTAQVLQAKTDRVTLYDDFDIL